MSTFHNLVRLADKIGSKAKAKTSLKVKTEEGTVTLTVKGGLALTTGEALNLASASGGTMTHKAEAGFGHAEGSGGTTFDGRSAAMMVTAMCNGFKKDDEDENDADDTDTEKAGNKANAGV